MRKKLVASGIILFITGVLVVLFPEEIKVHVEIFPFSIIGIMIGIVGIILAITGFFTFLADRL